MIELTRLSGSKFVLNADLIERIESSPDTIIWLTDGKSFVVTESVEEVVAEIGAARVSLIVSSTRALDAANLSSAPGPRLAVVAGAGSTVTAKEPERGKL